MTLFEKLKSRCKRHLRGVIGHGNLRGKETEGETKRPQGGKEKEAELQRKTVKEKHGRNGKLVTSLKVYSSDNSIAVNEINKTPCLLSFYRKCHLLCGRHCSKDFTYIYLLPAITLYGINTGTILTLTFQMSKLRQREDK